MASPKFEESYYKGLKYSDVFKSFSVEKAGTSPVVWTPASGKTIKLKGWRITGIVKTVLAAANPVQLGFYDSGSGGVLIGMGKQCFTANQAAGTGQFEVGGNLAEGHLATGPDATLAIGTNDSIGSGVILVTGVLWGEEV